MNKKVNGGFLLIILILSFVSTKAIRPDPSTPPVQIIDLRQVTPWSTVQAPGISKYYFNSFPFISVKGASRPVMVLNDPPAGWQVAFPFISFQNAVASQIKPAGPPIGLIAGHTRTNPKGAPDDPGTVCSDGLTEQSVNYKIASLVKQNLEKNGYLVDLLDEHDQRLMGYRGLLLLSIHSDSCDPIGPQATGFKAAGNQYNAAADASTRLTGCLINRYRNDTGLRFAFTSITPNMTRYHAFFEIDPNTPAAIIEAGFLYLDRKLLTRHTAEVSTGITDGLLCYLRQEYIGSVEP